MTIIDANILVDIVTQLSSPAMPLVSAKRIIAHCASAVIDLQGVGPAKYQAFGDADLSEAADQHRLQSSRPHRSSRLRTHGACLPISTSGGNGRRSTVGCSCRGTVHRGIGPSPLRAPRQRRPRTSELFVSSPTVTLSFDPAAIAWSLVRTRNKLASRPVRTRRRISTKRRRLGKCDELLGTCPCCFRDATLVSATTTIAPHDDYGVTTVSHIVAECHGVGFPPFEISTDGSVSLLAVLNTTLAARRDSLAQLDTALAISVRSGTKLVNGHLLPTFKELDRQHRDFDRAVASRRAELAVEIKAIEAEVRALTKRIASWKPLVWPRTG